MSRNPNPYNRNYIIAFLVLCFLMLLVDIFNR